MLLTHRETVYPSCPTILHAVYHVERPSSLSSAKNHSPRQCVYNVRKSHLRQRCLLWLWYTGRAQKHIYDVGTICLVQCFVEIVCSRRLTRQFQRWCRVKYLSSTLTPTYSSSSGRTFMQRGPETGPKTKVILKKGSTLERSEVLTSFIAKYTVVM